MNIPQQLEQLEKLRSEGSLSDAEFQIAKNRVIAGEPMPPYKQSAGMIHGIDERTWCTLMHISQLLIYSAIGIVIPIAMWILGKDKSDLVRRHGNRMMNWIISGFIYGVVASILCLVFIGFPLLLILAVLSIVFPILAALKCNNGEVWSYPLAIKFLPED
ncbi:DUF4870 domain-containing protein [Mariniblastus fucicola]|uniref:SHOCT domain-containing protein n=1 Tax=Mariniblastus fucicola TaxID=980251 RepID=A0A5B9PKE7_9BACT|nr:DUF4870 domain-containing protein [Mariniblastus fucicola]QEG23141.1 hypothetical protein MFFC18_30360 [Mariniblastus fucicola]